MVSPALTPAQELVVTALGLGRIRPAPGTWGSLPPVILAAIMLALTGHAGWAYHLVMLALLVSACVACVVLGDRAEAHFDRTDPSSVVIDEVAGMTPALLLLPWWSVATPGAAAFTLVYAFFCFRALDILKPWPCGKLQDHPAGWGILLDDLGAGVLAMAALQIVTRGFMGQPA